MRWPFLDDDDDDDDERVVALSSAAAARRSASVWGLEASGSVAGGWSSAVADVKGFHMWIGEGNGVRVYRVTGQ